MVFAANPMDTATPDRLSSTPADSGGGQDAKGQAEYPADHQPGMQVPKGGSSCSSCEYLQPDGKTCGNEYFQKWNGSNVIPAPPDQYCSDWWEPKEGQEEAEETEEQEPLAADHPLNQLRAKRI